MFYRFMTETGIHLLFLMKRGNAEIFQSYRRASLASEKNFLRQANQWKDQVTRGRTRLLTNEEFAAIETVTKASFERAGVKLEDAEQECKWGGDTRRKAESTDTEYQYELGFRFGCQFVHGTWYKLEHFHLLRLPDGYGPNTSYRICDANILRIPTTFSERVTVEYLLYITPDRKHPLESRMADFSEWLVREGAALDEFRKQGKKRKLH